MWLEPRVSATARAVLLNYLKWLEKEFSLSSCAAVKLGVALAGKMQKQVTFTNGSLVWKQAGACRGLDAAIFHPDPTKGQSASQALAVCGECVIQKKCLDFALSAREDVGVWGGTTERERRRIRRQRRQLS